MSDLLSWLFLAVFGTSGLLWAIIASRRKRPRLKLRVKGDGVHSVSEPNDVHIFLHCKVDNLSPENNSISEAHFGFMNKRETELIWNSTNVKLYEYDPTSNYIGKKIGPALRIKGNTSREFIAVLHTNREVVSQYIGTGSLVRFSKDQEKPFEFRLILIDANGSAFTGNLQSKNTMLINYHLLQYLDHKSIDLLNDNMYGRPRLKHLCAFYIGSMRLRLAYWFKRLLYELGLFAGTQ